MRRSQSIVSSAASPAQGVLGRRRGLCSRAEAGSIPKGFHCDPHTVTPQNPHHDSIETFPGAKSGGGCFISSGPHATAEGLPYAQTCAGWWGPT